MVIFLGFAMLPVTYGLNILGVGWIFCVDPNLDIPCEPLKVFYEHSFRYFVLRSQKPKTFSTFSFFTTERWHKQKLQSSGNYFIFIDKRPRCGFSFIARVCVSKITNDSFWKTYLQYNPVQRESFRITCFNNSGHVSLFQKTLPIWLFRLENTQSWKW